jgi:uncharacterized protein
MCAHHAHVTRRTPGRVIARGLIRAYQLTLSPLIGRQCRYEPTCSHYMDGAIARYGFWAGGWMGLARFLRCNPLGSSGYDPVPDGLDPGYRWYAPWRGARWTGRHIDPTTRWDG